MTVPAGFTETQVLANLSSPTHMTVAPDGRIFISQKNGALRVYKNGQLRSTPFVTLTVNTYGERGLQGIAFDPDFATNNYIYVFYTAQNPTIHNRVSRFTANGDVAVAGSEVVLIDFPASGSVNHNGGSLEFGPDGKLYIGLGDDSTPANGQSLNSIRGKVLRINKDGSIPEDNPHYNQTSGVNRAIWARGFRNPFQLDFQPGTGKLYINDVGPGEVEADANTWEEVNEGVAGGNYGWAGINGFRTTQTPPTGYRDPVYAYNHLAEGLSRAITGGVFYNPPAGATQPFPDSYIGKYFFAELTGGYTKLLDGATGTATLFTTGTPYIVDLEVAPDGGLYYLSFGTNQSTGSNAGTLYKISYTASDAPDIGTQPQSKTVGVGESATFTVTASGSGLGYQWQRNGQNIPGATASSYTLTNAQLADSGAQFRVIVSNGSGSDTSDPAALTVSNNQSPVPIVSTPVAGTTFAAGQTFTFAGSATDPEDGVLGASNLTWGVDYFTGEVSRPLLDAAPGAGGDFTIPTLSPYRRPDVFYRAYVTATDSEGRSATAFVDIQPQLSTITLNSSVPGLGLELDGQPVADDSAFEGVVSLVRSLGAPATQTHKGKTYEFVGWSDGGAIEHDISTPAVDTVFTAVYQEQADGVGDVDFTPALIGNYPTAAVTGERGKAVARVTNAGSSNWKDGVTVRFFLSSDGVIDGGDTEVASITKRKLNAGKSKTFRAKFDFPAVGDGSYVVLAQIDSAGEVTETNESNNVAASPAIGVTAAAVNLTGGFASDARRLLVLTPVSRTVVQAVLSNTGNVAHRGPVRLQLYATTDPDAGTAGGTLVADVARTLRINPGSSASWNVHLDVPGSVPAGNYYLLAVIDPLDQIIESNENDNLFSNEPVT